MRQRRVFVRGTTIDDHGVPLAERATPRVLAGEADRTALEQQRAERERLGDRPVDAALGDHLGPLLQLRQQPRMHGEALGHRDLRVADRLQHLRRDRGRRRWSDRHLRRAPRVDSGVRSPRLSAKTSLELALVVAQRRLGLFDRDVAAPDQRLGVELADAALGVDQVVHDRLGEARLVDLAVAASAVAEHVDDDVLLERLPELIRQ